MTLQPQERKAIIDYRIGRAMEALTEAVDNLRLQHWNLVANRLYYSVFYVCSALLIKNGIMTSTHAGVIHMINLHFVRTGILSKDEAHLLSDLFKMRQTGDYDDIFDWTEDDVAPLISPTEALVGHIITLLQGSRE